MHIDKASSVAINFQVYGLGIKKWWLFKSEDKEGLIEYFKDNEGTLLQGNVVLTPADFANITKRFNPIQFTQKVG